MNNNNIIMVIAGSLWQIPIIKKIKEMGYRCLVVNLYDDSPAFPFADFSEVVDILDQKACLKIAEAYNIIGVLSDECDIAMPTVAYIAEQLNLPSLGSDLAALYTNKYLMRKFCKKNHFPHPEYALCKSLSDAERFFTSCKSKIIIKPLDSSSSRGVFTISSINQLKIHFPIALAYSKIDKAIIAEKYITGKEFTADGIMIKGKHYTLAVSKKSHYEHNINIANELFFSYTDDEYDYNQLRELNNQFVETSNLPDGCFTHSEYKYENGNYYLIETAARGGGNLISSAIIPLLSGFDNYEYLINTTVMKPNKQPNLERTDEQQKRCTVLHFFDIPSNNGVVTEIKGEDYLKSSPNIIEYKLNFKLGDKIEKAVNDASRIGFYIAYADTKALLIELQNSINNKFNLTIR